MEQKTFFSSPLNRTLGAWVMVSAVIALLIFAYSTYKTADMMYGSGTIISVEGEGEVLAIPDIGSFSFSVVAQGETAAEAQERSATAINEILAYLEESGVAKEDVKTQNYNVYPNYRYEERICISIGYCPPGEQVIDGYEVSQSVTVKVRAVSEAGTLISGAGERGATNISSLQFTVDDPSGLQAEAQALAINDAKEKAQQIAKNLGMRVVKIVGFNEDDGGYYPQPYMMKAEMAYDEGFGGVAPELPVGEETIHKRVYISYELK